MAIDSSFISGLTLRAIGRDVDVGAFRCNEAIDWYLTQAACDHHEKRITMVSCWLHGADLAGYVTTSMTEVALDEAPLRTLYGLTEILFRKGQGHRKRFPALLIGMLGVCEKYKRRGLGEHMVKYAIGQASALSADIGCRFVTVDSDDTPEATGLYRKIGFAAPDGQKRSGNVRMHYDLGLRT
jgi:GNAT superfamily N-acetyltransferase